MNALKGISLFRNNRSPKATRYYALGCRKIIIQKGCTFMKKCINKKALCVLLSVMLTVSVFAACLVFSASAEDANLLAGNHYTAEGPTRAPDNLSDTNEDGTCKYRLTDGTITDNPGSADVGAYGQGTVTFIFDLGEKKDISSFHCVGYSGDWGILAPTSVEFFVSDDGTNYTSVGAVEKSDDNTTSLEGNWVKHDFNLEKAAAGKFIKVVYNTASHTWVSEIEAFGKAAAGDTSTAESTAESNAESTAASTAESTAASTATSSTGTTETGDFGVAAIALLAVVAAGGVLAVRKFR